MNAAIYSVVRTAANKGMTVFGIIRGYSGLIHGELTELESAVYRHLKRSPYRYYLDDDHFSASDVVYIKIVTTREQADRLRRELEPMLEKMKLRAVIRSQTGLEEGCSLYFYAAHADMEHARAHLMHLLRQKEPELERCDIAADRAYRSETDAVRLLRKVDGEYEPLLLSALLRKEAGRHSVCLMHRWAHKQGCHLL